MPVPVGNCKEAVVKMPLWQLLPEWDLSSQPGSPGGSGPFQKDRASLVQQPPPLGPPQSPEQGQMRKLLLLLQSPSAIPVSLEGFLKHFPQPPFSPRSPKPVLSLPFSGKQIAWPGRKTLSQLVFGKLIPVLICPS